MTLIQRVESYKMSSICCHTSELVMIHPAQSNKTSNKTRPLLLQKCPPPPGDDKTSHDYYVQLLLDLFSSLIFNTIENMPSVYISHVKARLLHIPIP